MDSEHLLVWLEIVPQGVTPIRVGMLCRRHADAMVVPRGWTLDDRREAKPRLFRVGEAATTNHPSRGRKPRARPTEPVDPPLQLNFDETQADPPLDLPLDPEPVVTVADIIAPTERDLDETQAMPWRPVFDHSDDLDGLLKADSPLLSRAFRGRDAKPPRS
jgi:hypothetical protein